MLVFVESGQKLKRTITEHVGDSINMQTLQEAKLKGHDDPDMTGLCRIQTEG